MSVRYCLLLAITLFSAAQSYAGDCVKSFDQSCLSEEYNSGKIEADYQQQQQNLEVHCKTTKEEEEEERIAYLQHEADKKIAIQNFLNTPIRYEDSMRRLFPFAQTAEYINQQTARDVRQIAADMDRDFLQNLADQKRVNIECLKAAAMREQNKTRHE